MSTRRPLRRILSIRVKNRVADSSAPSPSFLTRLARSEAGNAMAMMAAGIFPLAGLVGGAFDMSRLYLVKTRLQQACDAGALAGRRVMGAGQWSANGNAARTSALQFFDGNFQNNAYGTTGRTRSFSEAAGRVTGTASVTVPMTLMRIFGEDEKVLTVNCDAEMRLPNTDIMFVLDTTGSMDQNIPGESNSKISTLRFAVKCFYETVARWNTSADCTPGSPPPTGGTGNQTQIRFGFVPYATNVNVGRLLPSSYLADSWTYQSRTPVYANQQTWTNGQAQVVSTSDTTTSTGTWSTQPRIDNVNSVAACQAAVPANTALAASGSESGPQNQQTTTSGNSRVTTWYTTQAYTRYEYRYSSYDSRRRRCFYQRRTITVSRRRDYQQTDTATVVQVFDGWRYQPVTFDIRPLKNSPGYNPGVSLPVGNNGTGRMVLWDGCIEERPTVRASSYSPIPANAYDLNVDLVPSSGTSTSLWGPALPGAVYARGVRTDWSGSPTYSPVDYDGDYVRADQFAYSCPSEARKLQVWNAPGLIESYVNNLNPSGNTYHDIGLIWGARLMSPTGIFASENATTPQGGEIERHMIFMTDGETCTSEWNYAAYGLAWYDRRQTPTSSAPTGGCIDSGSLTQQVNARFTALCSEVKNRNITLWVVYFGTTDQSTLNRMTACATPGRFFYANNSAALISSFSQIADQISQLRLTR